MSYTLDNAFYGLLAAADNIGSTPGGAIPRATRDAVVTAFIILMVLASIAMIVVVLMQKGTNDNVGVITGASDTYYGRNKEKGKKKVQERFFAVSGAVKTGDTLTTKQLVEMGYTDDKARKRLIDRGVLKRIKRGFYLMLSV